MTPGGPGQSVPFNVANPSTGSQDLSSVVVTVANADGSAWTDGDCSADDYVVDAPVIAYGTVAGLSDVDGTVTISMIDTGVNQDDCQTAEVPLLLRRQLAPRRIRDESRASPCARRARRVAPASLSLRFAAGLSGASPSCSHSRWRCSLRRRRLWPTGARPGPAAGSASTGSLAPPTDVVVPATSESSVPISWTASTGPTPVAYYVERDDGTGFVAACGTSPAAPTSATSCTDSAVAGTYTYRVIAVHRSWTATSATSGEVTVSDPDFLGAAASFSILGVDATNSAVSTVSGDVGVTPMGAVVGFDPAIVGGDIHVNDSAAAAAAEAALDAYNELSGRDADTQFPGDPIGLTFAPGVHHTIGAMTFTGNMTLDAQGDPDAIFVFQVNGAITTAANSHVLLINGATASNVYWQVNGASGHGANSTFSGTILALGAITLGANVELIGRALSQAAVTLGGNVVRFTIAPSPTVEITSAAVTKDTTPTIAGTTTAVAGRPVTVTVGAQILTTTVQAGGTGRSPPQISPPATTQ